MEQLHNGFTLELCPGSFPLSTDSIALADFVRLPKNARVLDLGSGCGTLGMMLLATDPHCQVTGIEIDAPAHETALKNAAANCVGDRFQSICADLRTIASLTKAGSFDLCVSNPPYFSGGFLSKHHATARQELFCDPEALFRAAAYALRFGGDFYIVHKPEKLSQLCSCAAAAGLEAKRLRLVRHQPNSQVSLILLQLRKGAKPGLVWEELCLYNADGSPTEDYRRLYHL